MKWCVHTFRFREEVTRVVQGFGWQFDFKLFSAQKVMDTVAVHQAKETLDSTSYPSTAVLSLQLLRVT